MTSSSFATGVTGVTGATTATFHKLLHPWKKIGEVRVESGADGEESKEAVENGFPGAGRRVAGVDDTEDCEDQGQSDGQ